MQQRRDRVQWVYAAKNNRELEERYDEWADEYDRDLREEFDWIAPRATVGLFGKYVAQDAKILDAGVGTGLVGECLIDAGYHDLHGIDLSMRMLDMARRKAMYRELRQMTLGEALDFADDTFDAVISVGVFTTGHAPAHAFDELIRITRNGGYIFFSLKTELHEEG
ncbi:MAG: class I SAM-dependent methyltransferase, partial [Gammaproteobacteria bacterium]|nr:class I SAM-dependent methyltransferase [Gammaproteobacteria bacterium]